MDENEKGEVNRKEGRREESKRGRGRGVIGNRDKGIRKEGG